MSTVNNISGVMVVASKGNAYKLDGPLGRLYMVPEDESLLVWRRHVVRIMAAYCWDLPLNMMPWISKEGFGGRMALWGDPAQIEEFIAFIQDPAKIDVEAMEKQYPGSWMMCQRLHNVPDTLRQAVDRVAREFTLTPDLDLQGTQYVNDPDRAMMVTIVW